MNKLIERELEFTPAEAQTFVGGALRMLDYMGQLEEIRLLQMGISLDGLEDKLRTALEAVNETLSAGDGYVWRLVGKREND